jgi:hypothetical protein
VQGNAAARWDFKSMKTTNGIKQAPPALRALTRQLLAHGRSNEVKGGEQIATDCICQKLGHRLVQVLGELGFEALLARALALAKMEAPALREVELVTGQGVEALCKQLQTLNRDHFKASSEAQELILANLLWLLGTFIGTDLTQRMMQEIWPDLTFNDAEGVGEGGWQ